jgi:hypothetical protein
MAVINHLTEIKKCTTFIFIEKEGKAVPNGTGFFVGVKDTEKPDSYKVYLVTAKHVLKDEKGEYFSVIYIRLNKLDGTSDLIKIDLKGVKIMTHADNDVDIALFSCLPDQKIYDFKFLPDNLISTNDIIEKNGIAEGDEVFFTGLFTSYIGQKRNQPIVRFGKVALMPDEKIEWKEKNKPVKLIDLYLLECQSYGGNSGSPVFFQLNPLRKPGQISLGGPVIFLAGLMTGSFLNGSEVQITEAKDSKLFSLQNIGIAAVTPAQKLYETFFPIETKE